MSERELKPCPFCGGEATVTYGPTGPVHRAAHAGCLNGCKMRFTVWSKDDSDAEDPKAIFEAIDAWNRRAPAGESVTGWAEYLDGNESEGWSQWRFDVGSPNEDSHGRVRAVLTFIDSP